MTNSDKNFQYDSCVSKGICSINPRTFSLQRVLILFLILIAKYAFYLYKKGIIDDTGKDLILKTLAVTVSNPNFTEDSFQILVREFKKILPVILKKYEKYCDNSTPVINLENLDLFKASDDIIQAIRFGEKDIQNFQNLSVHTRNLFRIMLVIAKSISINLMNLETFGKNHNTAFGIILELLCSVETENENNIKLKEIIEKGSKTDCEVMKFLRNEQEKRYGTQTTANVSFTTVPSKAVLVVGSNITELENILEGLKNTDIDVYTHDEMMIAYTFPKFLEYKNLKGHYGCGVEHCLLDFATFPGPIILTKYSLHNIENFYRGRLFTTDYTFPKGVIKIDNNDFREVIKSAQDAKGFKTGKICETVSVGYSIQKIIKQILKKVEENHYKQIFIIGLEDFSPEQKEYFDKLTELIPQDILTISFSYMQNKSNFLHLNACFDSYSVVRLFELLNEHQIPISVFIPKCNRTSISQMIYMQSCKNTKIFIGSCEPIVLNPSLLETLENIFGITHLSSPEADIENAKLF